MENPVRPNEWALLQPLLAGRQTMLELGNKKNTTVGVTYKAWFASHGFEHTSVDINGEDGAHALDLRKPLAPELQRRVGRSTFDVVTNIGTTEHVVDTQTAVWLNILHAIKPGGALLSITPSPGDWWWHGHWYPTAEFYVALAGYAGLSMSGATVGQYGDEPHRCTYLVATAPADYAPPYALPDTVLSHLYRNKIRRRNS